MAEKFTLSPDQVEAIDKAFAAIRTKRWACIAGPAGSGKTSVMAEVIERWESKGNNVLLFSPTGVAAKRLSEQTGENAVTIHCGFYGKPEKEEELILPGEKRKRITLKFGPPHPPIGCDIGTLVIIDEFSMCNEELVAVIKQQVFSAGGSLLFIGDHEQIGPVEGTWGIQKQDISAHLTTIHRQEEGSDLLDLVTCIRENRMGQFTAWGSSVQRISKATIEQAVAWFEEGREADIFMKFASLEDRAKNKNPSRVLITWTNDVRIRANALVRETRNYPKACVQKGETLICTANNHQLGIMNGEGFEVASVEPCRELSEAIGATVQWVTEEPFMPGRARKFLVLPQAFDVRHPQLTDRSLVREAWKPLWVKARPEDPEDKNTSAVLCKRMGWGKADLQNWRDTAGQYSLQATWGYCRTAHRSQGDQWSEIGFLSCPGFRRMRDPDERKRLIYTITSRGELGFVAFILEDTVQAGTQW